MRGGKIFCPIVDELRVPTPEERVRQSYVLHLNRTYGYSFQQMGQERRTQAGHRSPKADIVIWESEEQKQLRRSPVIVIECKAEGIDIIPRDYYQGESYARSVGAQFLVMHNARHTIFFKLVAGAPGELVQIEAIPAAADWSSSRRIEEIKNSTRAFSRKEFQDLLHRCHGILRDVHKMEPGTAFDAISKVLFIKMYIERTGTWGTFTTEFLDRRNETRLPTEPPVHERLFQETKDFYSADAIFAEGEELVISEETFRRIVRELQGFNLSATGDDVKGLAFERFLGDTFRGKLGQYFTPRPVVEFMVSLLNPQENDLVCDPAAGSGGFLIHTFEHVRRQIEAEVQAAKDQARSEIEAAGLSQEDEEREIERAFATLNRAIDPEQETPPSRIYTLAHDRIFGTDAEPRAARTAKMNMIMHGDGHGGIHYRDGLLDVNGIFEGRFDIVLTNPPFGSNVGDDQKVDSSEQTKVVDTRAYRQLHETRYGAEWAASHTRLRQAARDAEPILNLFEIGKDKVNRPTEVLFLERCLRLLKGGGKLGIVLPDGNLNNPSLEWLRRWSEGKARLLAVVSLPEETFDSADATVKASAVFMRRFTNEDDARWRDLWALAHESIDGAFAERLISLHDQFRQRACHGNDPALIALLNDLSAVRVRRELPPFAVRELPSFMQGAPRHTVVPPRWKGTPSNKQRATELKEAFDQAAKAPATQERLEDALRDLRVSLRKLDAAHNAELWRYVKERFDYPIFFAAPQRVGITSTGAPGENDLPKVLRAYRAFEQWQSDGAPADRMPAFVE